MDFRLRFSRNFPPFLPLPFYKMFNLQTLRKAMVFNGINVFSHAAPTVYTRRRRKTGT